VRIDAGIYCGIRPCEGRLREEYQKQEVLGAEALENFFLAERKLEEIGWCGEVSVVAPGGIHRGRRDGC
jgi:hypothetical protein